MSEIEFFKVGGCVRDAIMGRPSKDVDFTVVAPSFEAMRQEIVERGATIFVESPQFATIRARVGKDVFDFVWARIDGPSSDGRRPDWVRPGTLQDDLARRDFTMNAIAQSEKFGVIDPFGGRADIARGVIRCVGDPDTRFQEDGLRILRAIRFFVRFDFSIEPRTEAAMIANKEMISAVSVERVREEVEQAFVINTPMTIHALQHFGLTDIVFSRGLRASATLKG